ncbi:MAG: hypothetical protein QXX46_04870 [Candidatus Anstonellales archaeon]
MIVDGKTREFGFTKKFREFARNLGFKGRDVLVAGIIGTGILSGKAGAQQADSLVIDTSSVHIDSTYIDWSKPRFMGLTYGYYYDWFKVTGVAAYRLYMEYGMSYSDALTWLDSVQTAGSIKTFPYNQPQTREDTIKTIIDYFKLHYNLFPKSDTELEWYIKTHPNKAEQIKTDWYIIRNSPYWPYLVEVGSKR